MERRRAGFTLAEVLVTLGITAVLLALAVPGVAAVGKSLKMAELDATARELFLAAQNSLTERSAAGGGGALPAGAEGDDEAVVCLMSGDGAMEKLLPPGAVDTAVAANHFMVVYYPQTLTVKEVYYSERAFDGAGQALRDEYGPDKAAARRRDEVGFYDGGNTSANPPRSLPKPELTIENGEELVVRAGLPGLEEELIGNVALSVTVSSRADPERTHVFPPVTAVNGGETVLVLDSLTRGQFKDLCPEIAPGDDIVVTAEAVYTGGGGGTWLSARRTAWTNSLFAAREGPTAKIACGRHLQNLDMQFSGLANNLEDPVSAAVQTEAVLWDGGISFVPIYNWELTSYDGRGLAISDLTIQGSAVPYRKRVGLFADFESTGAAAKAELKNVVLVDPKIDALALMEADTGALAGRVTNVAVENCRVYATEAESAYVKGSGPTGGLFGMAVDCRISQCASGLPVVYGSGSTELKLGGLIGSAESTSLAGCYAAADQLSGRAKYTGGLIGYGKAVEAESCYAVGNISAVRAPENGFISGFMNGNGDGRVRDAYCAMTYFDGEGAARELEINFGFMPTARPVGCAYLAPNAPVKAINEQQGGCQALSYGELMTWRSAPPWTALDRLFSHPYRTLEEGEPERYPFPGLLTGAGTPLPHYGSWPKEPEAGAGEVLLVYYELHQDGAGNRAYGLYYQDDAVAVNTLDRPDAPVVWDGYALLCGEELGDTKVAVAAAGGDNQGNDNSSLIPAGEVRLAEGESRWLYLIPGAAFTPIKGHDLRQFYASVTVGTGKDAARFYCNPWLAKTAVRAEEPPQTPAEAAVRTPRHLRYLGEFTQEDRADNLYPGLRYTQERDLDYATYLAVEEGGLSTALVDAKPYSALGIDLKSISLRGGGAYDGRSNRILHLPIPLFRTLASGAAVRNVTVAESAILEYGAETGILAGSNNGSIENCEVRDGEMTYGWEQNAETEVWYTAGFVGANEKSGTIRNCRVAGSRIRGLHAAGFVVTNSGVIDACRVYPGDVEAPGYDSVTVEADYVASGFVYQNDGEITGCFAAAEVVGGTSGAGFAWNNGGSLLSCYANCMVRAGADASGFVSNNDGTVADCYALKEVTSVTLTAAGFCASNTGEISTSYSAAVVKAKDPNWTYGFAPPSEGILNACHYLKQEGIAENEAGSPHDYSELEKLELNNIHWGGDGESHPFENTGEYPFPMLVGLDHWGDWPRGPADFPAEDNILGVFYYTATPLGDGRYQFSVYTSALKCGADGKTPPEERDPFATPLTVVLEPDDPPDPFGMGVFWSDGFHFDVTGGKDKGYFYEGAGGDVRLSDKMADKDLGFDPGYRFVPVEPKKSDDGAYEIELEFKHNGSGGINGHDWDCEFQYSEEKGLTIDLDLD